MRRDTALKGLCSYIAIMYFKDGKDYFLFSLCLKKKKSTPRNTGNVRIAKFSLIQSKGLCFGFSEVLTVTSRSLAEVG